METNTHASKPDLKTEAIAAFRAPRPPDTLLILGTDAAGKNYVANFMADLVEADGQAVEKRDGWLSAPPSEPVETDDKSALARLAERLFLIGFPLARFLMPPLLALLLARDLAWLAQTYLDAVVLENNDLDNAALAEALWAACEGCAFTPSPPTDSHR